MRTLFLTSYFAGTVNQFKTFVKSKKITSKEVLFISTASNVEAILTDGSNFNIMK